MTIDLREEDRRAVVQWASELLGQPFMILDTESTGLGADAEIVQLAVLRSDGTEWVNTLIKCNHPEKLLQKSAKGVSAYDIHGIHPDMLVDAPEWADVHADLYAALMGERLIIYNSAYDMPLVERSCDDRRLLRPTPRLVECAMLQYAQWYGEYNDYRGSYKWQPLPPAPGAKAHDAMGDCCSVLALIKKMAYG